jgi:hypothetical protein
MIMSFLHEYYVQDVQEQFEDTKGLIIIRKSKNRQRYDQTKKDKRTNNYQQNIHIKLQIESHEPR